MTTRLQLIRVKPAPTVHHSATATRKRRPDAFIATDELDVERQSPTGSTRRRHAAVTVQQQIVDDGTEDKSGKRGSKLHKLLTFATDFLRNARHSPRWLLLTIALLVTLVPALTYYNHPAALNLPSLQQLAHIAISNTHEVPGLFVFTILHSSHALQPLQVTAIHSWRTYFTSLQNIVLVTESSAICGTYQELFPSIRCLSITSQCHTLPQHSPLAQCMLQEVEQIAARLDKQYVTYVDSTTVVYEELNTVYYHMIQQSEASLQPIVGVSNSYTLGISTEGLVPATLVEPQHLTDIRSQASALNSRSLDSIDLMLWQSATFDFRRMITCDYDSSVWQRWLLRQAMVQPSVSTINFGDAVVAVTQRLSGATNLHIQQHTKATWQLDELVQQQLKLASIDNVQTIYQRSPDASGFMAVHKPQQYASTTLFARHASSANTVTVLPVSQDTLADAMNWLCWAQRIESIHYVIHAQDETTVETLRTAGHPVLDDSVHTDVYETVLKVHSSGYHALLASPQSIWFSSPLPYIEQLSASYVGTIDVTGDESSESTGLSLFRATASGRRLISAIARCRSETNNANDCLRSSVRTMHINTPVDVQLLSQSPHFCSYTEFFEQQYPQQHGHLPVVVSTGSDDKLQQWQLQAYDLQSQQCMPAASSVPALPVSTELHPRLTLRVMAYDKPEQLNKLLASLQQVDYKGDTVNLVLSIDHPLPTPTAEHLAAWSELLTIARNTTWPHGAHNVIEHVEHVGGLGQYVKSWSPNDLNELTLFLDEDSVVSPHCYTWIKQSVQRYYTDSTQRHARMFGIALSPTDEIYGETNDHRYGSRHISSELPSELTLYKYQLAQPYGLLWFPQHFQAFQQWLSAKRVDLTHGIAVGSNAATACIPTLVTNTQWQLQPSALWSQWVNRFAYEYGLYALHTNYKDGALVTRHDQARQLLVNKDLPPSYTAQPALSALALYDFHFQPVHNAAALSYRQLMAPASQFDQCWTLQQLTQKIDVEKRAAVEQLRAEQALTMVNTTNVVVEHEHVHHIHEPVDDQALLVSQAPVEKQEQRHNHDIDAHTDDVTEPTKASKSAGNTKATPKDASKSKPSSKPTSESDKKQAAKPGTKGKATAKPGASSKGVKVTDSKQVFDIDAAQRQLAVSSDRTSLYRSTVQRAAKSLATVKTLFTPSTTANPNAYVGRIARYVQPWSAIHKGFQKSSYLTINDGLGFGALAVLLQNSTDAGAKVTASDVTIETLQVSHNAKLLQQPPKQLNPYQLKVTPNTVDFLVAHFLWQTTAEPSDVLHEMLRVARKGVVLVDCHETTITTELPSELFATSDFEKGDSNVKQLDAMQMLMTAQQQKLFIAYRPYYSALDAAFSNNEVKDGHASCKPLAVLLLKKQPTKYQLSLLTQAHWLMPTVKTMQIDNE